MPALPLAPRLRAYWGTTLMRGMLICTSALLLATLLALLPAVVCAQASAPPPGDPPLSFDRALALAQARAASILAKEATLAQARHEQSASGQLPDPRLTLGVDNLPVNGPDAYSLTRDFMTMRRIGLMQEVPNAAKRLAQGDVAQARMEREQAMLRAETLAVKRETAVAWLALYYATRRLEAFAHIDRESRILLATVNARVSGGQLMAPDALMARQDALLLADRRDELERDVAKARASLQRWIGPPAQAAMVGEPPDWTQTPEQVRAQVVHHTDLQVYAPMKRMAQAEALEALADEHGDWGWELAYSKRGPGFGDMVSFQFNMDLPLWRGSKQIPKTQARQQEVARIEAEALDAQRRHEAEVESQLADLMAIERAHERLTHIGLPLAQQRADLMLASYQAGRADLGSVLSARRDLAEQGLRAIDLQAQSMALRAQLHYVGDADDAPATQP